MTPAPASLAWMRGEPLCQTVWLVCCGLGVSTCIVLQPQSLLLLGATAGLFLWRVRRQAPLAVLPDMLTVSLPYLWAANVTDGFAGWWTWLQWAFLGALGTGVADLWANPGGRRFWRKSGIGMGLALALAMVLAHTAFLKWSFPLFTTALFLKVLHACLVFFGGIVISHAAWRRLSPGE